MKTILAFVLALFCFRSQAVQHFPHWEPTSIVQDQNGWHFTVTISILDMFELGDQNLIPPASLYTQEFYLDGIFQSGRAYDDTDTTLVFTGYIGDDLFGQTDFAAGFHSFTAYFGGPNGTARSVGGFTLETPTGDKPVIPTPVVPDSGNTLILSVLAIGLLLGVHRVCSVRA